MIAALPQKRRRKPAKRSRSPRLPWFLRRKFLSFVIGCVIFAGGFFFSEGRVIKVSDGDTIVVHTSLGKTERIRLYGVDSPESKQRGGQAATDFARDMLLFKPVTLHVVDTDRYGRTVALVKLEDGRIFNEELVKAGHAWVYRSYCNQEPLCTSMYAHERRAKKQGKGLWQDANPTPPWTWRRQNPRN